MIYIKNIFLVFSAVIVLFPSAVGLTHLISKHEHDVCSNYAAEHFHSKPLDCELYKFQQNAALELSFIAFEPGPEISAGINYPNHYYFLSDYQRLPFELRGPPVI